MPPTETAPHADMVMSKNKDVTFVDAPTVVLKGRSKRFDVWQM